jgi:hypothetical protein
MDISFVLECKNLNMRYWDSLPSSDLRKMEYSCVAKPRGISLEYHVETQCYLTTDAMKYVLFGDEPWVKVNKPTSEIFEVKLAEDHTFIVCGDAVYQSYWLQYPLKKTFPSCVRAIKRGEPFDWEEVTGVQSIKTCQNPHLVEYFEPSSKLDLAKAKTRCNKTSCIYFSQRTNLCIPFFWTQPRLLLLLNRSILEVLFQILFSPASLASISFRRFSPRWQFY